MSMNQKEATVSTILGVLEERGVSYELNGPTPISDVLTDSDKKSVRDALFTMFRNGDVTYKDEFQAKVDDDAELKKYISGLVNNWIRKHKPFNCGEAYKIKNPGSRAHVQDEQLRELSKLMTQVQATGDADAIASVQTEIDRRKSEIAAERAKTVEINIDALPEHLRSLVNK